MEADIFEDFEPPSKNFIATPLHICLLPDLISYKTAFDYLQIVCFVYSYLPVPDTF